MSGAYRIRPYWRSEAITWLNVLRRYILIVVPAHLTWEIARLPLYTIWRSGRFGEIAFAVARCTSGDILIAASSLLTDLLLIGTSQWPEERYWAVTAFALTIGLGCTTFSEWLNATVRQSWTYTELMPRLSAFGIGVSPLAQWIIIPLAAFWLVRPRTAAVRGHEQVIGVLR